MLPRVNRLDPPARYACPIDRPVAPANSSANPVRNSSTHPASSASSVVGPCATRIRSFASYEVNLPATTSNVRSEEHTSELQSRQYLVCRLLLEKKQILS